MATSPLIVNNLIDSCAFDPKYEPESTAASRILHLSEQGHFLLQVAHSTQKEVAHPNTPPQVKAQAAAFNYTLEVILTPGEQNVLHDIRTILAGNGRMEKILQDAQHVFEAQKYGRYFITTDARILARASLLRERCTVEILLPSAFLALVLQFMGEGGSFDD